jgi:hypothetical protein
MMRSQEMGAVTAYAAPGPTHIFRLSIVKTRQGFAWGGRESSDGFNQDVAHTVQVMANEVNGKPTGAAPDLQVSAARLEEQILKHSADHGLPLRRDAPT